MDRALEGRHEARAHRYTLGPQCEGRRHAAAVNDAAGGDDRDVDLFPHCLEQGERVNFFRIADAGALGSLDDQTVDAGVDALVLDTAHGHSQGVLDATAKVRELYPDVQLVAGNIATREAALALVEIGVDAVIVQDLGVYRAVRQYFPQLELHGSTQMAVHNRAGAETLTVTVSERGATRMDDRTSEASMEKRKKEGYF